MRQTVNLVDVEIAVHPLGQPGTNQVHLRGIELLKHGRGEDVVVDAIPDLLHGGPETVDVLPAEVAGVTARGERRVLRRRSLNALFN